ncbi:MAG: hypothetical protein ACK559_27250, partial [bacterium]
MRGARALRAALPGLGEPRVDRRGDVLAGRGHGLIGAGEEVALEQAEEVVRLPQRADQPAVLTGVARAGEHEVRE